MRNDSFEETPQTTGMTVLAIDVYYHPDHAKVAGVLFDWSDKAPQSTLTAIVSEVAPYQPGQFYKREMPCILELLKQVNLETLSAILVDSHVFVSNKKDYGLGGHLWESLGEVIPIVGVAKRSFHNTEKVTIPVTRGKSTNPLYVSAVGMEVQDAARLVEGMKGTYRIPDILKTLDQLSRS